MEVLDVVGLHEVLKAFEVIVGDVAVVIQIIEVEELFLNVLPLFYEGHFYVVPLDVDELVFKVEDVLFKDEGILVVAIVVSLVLHEV